MKSVKYHLRRVIGNVSLTFEEMSTVLSQILLQCRQTRKTYNRSLTPGNFLIATLVNELPELDVTDVKVNRLNRWQHL